MKWITRKNIHVNRAATAWLVRRFVDPGADLLFVEPEQVAPRARELDAVSFDAPGALYPHKDHEGRCSFEQLVAERPELANDPALVRLALIVHGADFPEDIDVTPESAGLWAISQGFTLVSQDDHEILEQVIFLYDSLYAHLKRAT
jgi:hypothetical protein